MLVNGCEIIGEKIVATNLPLRLPTTIRLNKIDVNTRNFVDLIVSWNHHHLCIWELSMRRTKHDIMYDMVIILIIYSKCLV